MRKIIPVILAAALLAVSCSERKTVQDKSPVTIQVTSGFDEATYRTLADNVWRDLGIEVEFVYEFCSDVEHVTYLDIVNNNMKADIVFTSARIPSELLKNSCVDLMAKSHITSYFNYEKVKECTDEYGAVYELPFLSKLIGITYNATLMEEMGWKLPRTFQDMLDLKKKCERAGVPFAVTDMHFSGSGFNYLFHLMGSQWLSSIEGEEWISEFLKGNASVDVFKERCGYFKKWVESGLFGNIYTGYGEAVRHFNLDRALFWYSATNNRSGYDGPMFDSSGKETPRIIHDVFKTMPWISEDGSNNCFTVYDGVWGFVSSALLAPDKEDKLARALKILEYIAGEDFSAFTISRSADNYLSLKSFKTTQDRLFSNFVDELHSGYIQPWYYNRFDANSIVNTGSEIGSYIINDRYSGEARERLSRNVNYIYDPDAEFDKIFEILNNNNNNRLNPTDNVLGTVTELLDRKATARLASASGALSLQKALDDAGENALVQVALLPYVEDIADLEPWRTLPVESSVVYPGKMESGLINVIVPYACYEVRGIYMTGARIKEIVKGGFEGYPYECVVRGDAALDDGTEYLVSVPSAALPSEIYSSLEADGKVIDTKAVMASGVSLYFAEHPEVSRGGISF